MLFCVFKCKVSARRGKYKANAWRKSRLPPVFVGLVCVVFRFGAFFLFLLPAFFLLVGFLFPLFRCRFPFLPASGAFFAGSGVPQGTCATRSPTLFSLIQVLRKTIPILGKTKIGIVSTKIGIVFPFSAAVFSFRLFVRARRGRRRPSAAGRWRRHGGRATVWAVRR